MMVIQSLEMNLPLRLINKDFISHKVLGIAVSGGVDSMVLLSCFQRIKSLSRIKIFVLHFNHRWRQDSIKDKILIEQYCKKHKLDFIYEEISPKIKKTEEAARIARYGFFTRMAKKYNLEIICTAHHFDDYIETVLFRIARGAGPLGLCPIKEISSLTKEVSLYRPFLSVRKNEIIAYAKKYHIPFNEDITNLDVSLKRNLIRRNLMPVLKEINPSFDKNIHLLSRLVSAQNDLTQSFFKNITTRIDKTFYFSLSKDIQDLLIYWFLNKNNVEGCLHKIDDIKLAFVQDKKIQLNKNYFLVPNKKYFSLEKINVKLKISHKLKISIQPLKNKQVKTFPADKENFAFVDLCKYNKNSLIVRTRKPSDIFCPLGCSYSVKLKKYFIDKKIEKNLRNELPLLCYKNEVLWIPGYALSEKIKVTKMPTHQVKLDL